MRRPIRWISSAPPAARTHYVRQTAASVDTAKEVKIFGLNGFLIERYLRLAEDFYAANRRLAIKRASWGALFTAIGTIAYYIAYAYIDAANTAILVKPDGTIESIANGKTSDLSTTTISNIISVAFSYDGKKILVTMRNGTITLSSVLDLTTKSWLSLPNGIQSPVWSPTNYQIAYLAPSNSGTETLMTIDAGIINAKPTLITMLDMEDMGLQWPNKNTIIISDRPSAYTTGSIWLFNISSGTLSSIIYENLGVESLWSASDSALIFSAKSTNAGGQLVFQNATGAQKILSFMTLPSKCAFGTPVAASDTANPSALIYCAVPSDQSTFSIARLPDEYDQKVYFTNDDFYRIDADTGLLDKIFSASTINQTIDATHIKIFNNILFFINRYDQKIYALAL